MKKFLLVSLSVGICSLGVLAYTQSDVDNANFLAERNIITSQTDVTKYRLDDTITRAEVAGIALKLAGVTLPNYTCKGYFSDVKNNDWICRAVELAADKGYVSRGNKKFRGQDKITRAEALVILMKSGRITIEPFSQDYFNKTWVSYSDVSWTDFPQFSADWQKNVFFSFMKRVNIDVPGQIKEPVDPLGSGSLSINYRANAFATRAEVFGFARNIIMQKQAIQCKACVLYSNAFKANFKVDVEKYSNDDVLSENYYFGLLERPDSGAKYSLEVYDTGALDDLMSTSTMDYLGNYSFKNRKYSLFEEAGMISIYHFVFPGKEKTILFRNGVVSDKDAMIKELENINFDPSVTENPYQPISDLVVLKRYYHLLNAAMDSYSPIKDDYFRKAFSMRSPKGVSLETFQSWYKNVTALNFREDTLKDLGNNTYEFLIDLTENGAISTYKVKSKVDLENFTIDSISSVKQ